MKRPLLIRGLAVCGIVTLLSSCSIDDRSGIGRSADGTPIVTNCGTWIEEVVVSEAESGRQIWAASIATQEDRDEGGHGVGDVTLGVLPSDSWSETIPVALEPVPALWQFSIDTGESSPEVIRVADMELVHGQVYVPGQEPVSDGEFLEDVCGYSSGIGLKIPGLLAIAGAMAALATYSIRRRRDQQRNVSMPATEPGS